MMIKGIIKKIIIILMTLLLDGENLSFGQNISFYQNSQRFSVYEQENFCSLDSSKKNTNNNIRFARPIIISLISGITFIGVFENDYPYANLTQFLSGCIVGYWIDKKLIKKNIIYSFFIPFGGGLITGILTVKVFENSTRSINDMEEAFNSVATQFLIGFFAGFYFTKFVINQYRESNSKENKCIFSRVFQHINTNIYNDKIFGRKIYILNYTHHF